MEILNSAKKSHVYVSGHTESTYSFNKHLSSTYYALSNEHCTMKTVMNKSAIPFLVGLWSSKECRHIENKNIITCFYKCLEHIEEQEVLHAFNKIKDVKQFIPKLLLEIRKILPPSLAL